MAGYQQYGAVAARCHGIGQINSGKKRHVDVGHQQLNGCGTLAKDGLSFPAVGSGLNLVSGSPKTTGAYLAHCRVVVNQQDRGATCFVTTHHKISVGGTPG